MAMCIVYLEGQSYETVFDPVGLVVSRVEGVAILPILAALPHPPIIFCIFQHFQNGRNPEKN